MSLHVRYRGQCDNALRCYCLMQISRHFRDCEAQLVTSVIYVISAILFYRRISFIGLLVGWLVRSFVKIRPMAADWQVAINISLALRGPDGGWCPYTFVVLHFFILLR